MSRCRFACFGFWLLYERLSSSFVVKQHPNRDDCDWPVKGAKVYNHEATVASIVPSVNVGICSMAPSMGIIIIHLIPRSWSPVLISFFPVFLLPPDYSQTFAQLQHNGHGWWGGPVTDEPWPRAKQSHHGQVRPAHELHTDPVQGTAVL